jgi:hypothetical protein
MRFWLFSTGETVALDMNFALRAALVSVLAFASAGAQNWESRGAVILALPTSPRSLGLAHASAAAVPDAWALFTGPAQLARLRTLSAGFASEAYLVSTQLSAAALSVPLRSGTIAVGASVLDYGSIDEIAAAAPGTDGTETGKKHSAADHVISVGYGLPVNWIEGMTIGVAAELVSSRIADLSGTAFAASLGVAWASRNGWDVVLSGQHLGAAMELGATRGKLPSVARGAVAAPARKIGKGFVRPLAEVRAEQGGGGTLAVAAEGEWSNASGAALQLRAGYSLRTERDDDPWPVSLGVGLVLGSWAIDYAPQHFTTIDQFTHRFGVRYARRASSAR